ncbi:sirohydrochlorin chelatase [Anabaena cylindrica FACHB-243]|uniref:Cobalamin (Vitamin B12) biosynthesis CbiX protein n=1 Tax=Anabaena cylindrica (strain ATCC 27899 / PCC 7122) TaxID=272123 RepID=K9ZG86_ANACC|nr:MULTISPECIES: sirohydrochlorin chelatase [Anabaena]AFZ57380.1 cobalamin (vitamin B12) biosynthesis CbiX protein [Anabaena cylindrica PCC 7122]MBD2421062.1 sirohydrochlorin chelatase [Anabaena cylindrica FACHB-243]MBY5284964.1 sirohydrochlorin chelatase [Anabaena sp. CCAP 1446/1C]MBY5306368.1 sirohydrochlorin chelatase [Anabaena sp. CCAP 1446/1C]MCM2405815.1 sirohydrochlorin chelatase [Anabaena sp. CCAP 1446/1C]
MPSAYLLLSHGSRDPRPEIAMRQLAKLISQKLANGENLVGIATLELNIQPLHQQIQDFAKTALALGCKCLKIVPLFLVPGVHVMTDIPAEVALAQKALGQDIIIDLKPYLGNHPDLEKLFTQTMATIKVEAAILLAHGSRRSGSQQPVETIAMNLGAVAAYWAVAPSLELRVKELVAAGHKQIAILPYFLFTGGITDAIALAVEELKLQFPRVAFKLAQPLGVSTELADLIWDLATEGEKVFG